jgi:3-hydroxyisobutyrate dehydrogenase-like beta-hydroxyacid dehydrogenase
MSQKPVGVIGLGLMGAVITERLLEDGFDVVVFNRTRDKAEPLVARGARWSDNPLMECDRVVVSLYTTDVVQEVLRQLEAGCRRGNVVIDTTTGDPQLTGELVGWLAERGVEYLEAPISGSSEQTRRREVIALAAGRREVFDSCRDILDSLAPKTFYVGRTGNALQMKLVTNLVLGLNRAALAEGLVFAEAMGIAAEDAFEVLMSGPAYSRTMDAKGPKMAAGDFTPQAKLSQHLKDVRIILAEAARAGQPLPISKLHGELLERAEAMGCGELDNSAIIRAIAREWRSPARGDASG